MSQKLRFLFVSFSEALRQIVMVDLSLIRSFTHATICENNSWFWEGDINIWMLSARSILRLLCFGM